VDTGTDYLLIVEDDPDILQLLGAALTFKGYRVMTAQNGREALEVIRRKHPALVIADIMMPKLDGFGLVHRMRINPETREIPVVFITAAYLAREDLEFALNIGATQVVQKPIDLNGFLETIAELLAQGLPAIIKPLKELDFYNEYRLRLEAKLEEKLRKIAREESLLAAEHARESLFIKASLRQTIRERDELQLLLDQIQVQRKKHALSD
jgi:CheY-like chemotaxis protein